MVAPVVKTLCDNLTQQLSPEPFATPTHNYYEGLGYTSITHHYIDPEAAQHCTDITKVKGLDATVANGGVITPSLQAKVPLAKQLSNNAHHTFILDKLKIGSLLSIG